MRKYGKWLLVLGILAANPAWVSADGFLSGLRPALPQSRSAQREANQNKAEQVAQALKQARLNGYDLEVEVRGDTVKLDGKVRDVNHRALADNVCRRVDGIERVLNNLKYVPSGEIQQTAGRFSDSALRPATYNVIDEGDQGIQQVHFQKPGKRTPTKKTPTQRNSGFTARPAVSRPAVTRPAATPQARPAAVPSTQVKKSPQATAAKPQVTVEAPPAVPPVAKMTLPEPTPVKVVEEAPKPAPTPAPKPAPTPAPKPAPMPEIQVAPKAIELTSTLAPKTPARPAQPVGPGNQEVAQNIADSLGQVGLVGYNIEVRYDDGTARLVGDVPTVGQVQTAGFAASRVPGVERVQNELKVTSPIAQTAFNGQGQPMPYQVHPASMNMSQGMAGPTAIAGAGNYSNPQLPKHAWPAYAQYPNSAAVQYPTQHSASAFPYIGPFYPYPQVPLGWREVQLQWDDGYWQLNFEEKKDAWYWLFAPRNWGGGH